MVERNASLAPPQQTPRELAWEDIDEPGAYVEVTTGALYRVPREALQHGASPRIPLRGTARPRFVQLSKDPFIFPLGARMVCARHNILPNF